MPRTQSGMPVGLSIAVGVMILACFFLYRQYLEISGREIDLPEQDQTYFIRKDRRRLLGSTLMMLVAMGMVAGVVINPHESKATGRLFGWIWLAVASLICVLLMLAFLDWIANRDYALRHHKQLIDERRAILEAEVRRRAEEKKTSHEKSSNGEYRPS